MNRIKYHKDAIAAYQLALKAGYDRPAWLYNNIGWSHLTLGEIDDAEKCLQRAIELDDNLQAAHYNIVVVSLKRSLRGQPIPKAAFAHASRAIAIGPPTADLYRNVAALYATAARRNPTLIQPAIEHVAKAVQLGADPRAFTSDAAFTALRKEPAFHDALKRPASASKSPDAVRLLDPLDKP